MAALHSTIPARSVFSQTRQRQSTNQSRAVVRCSAEPTGRRTALQFLTAIPLLVASPALAQRTDRDISDDRKALSAFRSMDQARDTDENQKNRFSMTESSGMSPEQHKQRIKESLSRLQKNVASDISKKHWPRVSNDLRGQMSTLRFDLDALNASTADKAKRKVAQKAQNAAMKALEELDFIARSNNKENNVDAAYKTAFKQLNSVVSSLG